MKNYFVKMLMQFSYIISLKQREKKIFLNLLTTYWDKDLKQKKKYGKYLHFTQNNGGPMFKI